MEVVGDSIIILLIYFFRMFAYFIYNQHNQYKQYETASAYSHNALFSVIISSNFRFLSEGNSEPLVQVISPENNV